MHAHTGGYILVFNSSITLDINLGVIYFSEWSRKKNIRWVGLLLEFGVLNRRFQSVDL